MKEKEGNNFEREIIRQFKALNKTLTEIVKLLTPKPHASKLAVSHSFEQIEGGGKMPQTDVPGPVPDNHRVVLTVVPTDDFDAPLALDGVLMATNDQAQFPQVDMTNPLAIVVRIDPPADLTVDSTITLSDSLDSEPTASVVIDWNGAIVVQHATRLGISVGFEPMS